MDSLHEETAFRQSSCIKLNFFFSLLFATCCAPLVLEVDSQADSLALDLRLRAPGLIRFVPQSSQ